MKKKNKVIYINRTPNLLNEVVYPPMFIKRVAEKAGIDISGYDLNELTTGFKIEMESEGVTTSNVDPGHTLTVVLAHLQSNPNYYSKLQRVASYLEERTPISKDITGKHKLFVTKSVDNLTPEKLNLIAEFIKFCCQNLGIKERCTVYLTGKRGGPIQTTASFNPNNLEIWIYVRNRHMLADPLRSLAHEIRHLKQAIDKVLTHNSGEDGSEHENEAHAFSGLMIRLFGKAHPEIFD